MEKIELGTILHMEKGKKPISQSKEIKDGYLPYVDIKAFEQGVIDNYASTEKSLLCKDGDLLIVCDGSRSGLTGIAIKGIVGSTLSKISADGLITKYLSYFIQSKYTLLNTQKKGTGTPHLKTEILKQSKLIVPSITIQEQVVSHIEELFSELDKAIETLCSLKEQLVLYRQIILMDAFKGIEKFRPVYQMSSVVTSGSRGWAQYYCDQGALFIRIGNLTRKTINLDLSEVQHVNLPQKAEGLRTRLQAKDVLVSITADLGSIGFIPDSVDEAYVNQHIAMIRFLNPNQGRFMAWYLRSGFGQKDLLKNKRGEGKLGLGLDDIRNTKVPDVSDKKAKEIVTLIDIHMSICDIIEQTVFAALDQAMIMKQSILKQAFEGD